MSINENGKKYINHLSLSQRVEWWANSTEAVRCEFIIDFQRLLVFDTIN